MRILIVGGSVAGCAAAVELGDAGHNVSVHERSPAELAGQGIGIVTDDATMTRLIDRGLVAPATPRVPIDAVRYVRRGPGGAAVRIADVEAALTAFHWSDLHRGLRAQVPDADYVTGDDVPVATAGAGTADLVVFADGHLSAGRDLIAPGTEVGYRGLVLWRGLVPEREVDVEAVEGTMTRIVYPGGHAVAYLIPGPDGDDRAGGRQLMWGFYLLVPEAELGATLTDRDGHRHGGSVPLGRTAEDVATSLRARLDDVVPDSFLELVDSSGAETSLQAIFSAEAERTHRDRSCLVGDAARVFPPFTLSGVLRAVDDAVGLRASLDATADVDAALDAWSAQQRTTTERVRASADRIERMLVHEVPDLDTLSADDAGRWLGRLHEGATVRLA